MAIEMMDISETINAGRYLKVLSSSLRQNPKEGPNFVVLYDRWASDPVIRDFLGRAVSSEAYQKDHTYNTFFGLIQKKTSN